MELQLFRISKKNRITQAKNLLRFTDLTVDEISTAIGLNDANYLARRFRKIEGMSPGEYRKKLVTKNRLRQFTARTVFFRCMTIK